MNLYLKYRPQSFEEILGNELVISTLKKALLKENHPHVYLFSGPAGTGKTTTARIMAKELGASDLDIREINTANNRGIDTAREIMTQMRQLPMSGESVVYILDECHKFTSDMQNALLKPLEDTPEHVYFFLCTTDSQKLIPALLTRCTEVKFSLLSNELIQKLIRRVSRKEHFDLSPEIVEGIADKAQGCPRRALVILERIVSIDNEDEQKRYLEESLIGDEDVDIIELCRLLLQENSSWKSIASLLKKLDSENKLSEPEQVRYLVLSYMNTVLLSGKLSDRAVAALEAFSDSTYNTKKYGITLACLRTII